MSVAMVDIHYGSDCFTDSFRIIFHLDELEEINKVSIMIVFVVLDPEEFPDPF